MWFWHVVIALVVMACIYGLAEQTARAATQVMAYGAMAFSSHGLCSYDTCSYGAYRYCQDRYGQHTCGLYSYGLNSCGLYRYGLYSSAEHTARAAPQVGSSLWGSNPVKTKNEFSGGVKLNFRVAATREAAGGARRPGARPLGPGRGNRVSAAQAVMAFIVMAYLVIAYLVMACIVMAYIVMTYIVMACIVI